MTFGLLNTTSLFAFLNDMKPLGMMTFVLSVATVVWDRYQKGRSDRKEERIARLERAQFDSDSDIKSLRTEVTTKLGAIEATLAAMVRSGAAQVPGPRRRRRREDQDDRRGDEPKR